MHTEPLRALPQSPRRYPHSSPCSTEIDLTFHNILATHFFLFASQEWVSSLNLLQNLSLSFAFKSNEFQVQ